MGCKGQKEIRLNMPITKWHSFGSTKASDDCSADDLYACEQQMRAIPFKTFNFQKKKSIQDIQGTSAISISEHLKCWFSSLERLVGSPTAGKMYSEVPTECHRQII